MKVFTTEITSDSIVSDNPIHQRLLKPYFFCKEYIGGNLLELGCGEGRGIAEVKPLISTYTGIDKIGEVVDDLRIQFPGDQFIQMQFPPFTGIHDNYFDSIISFQVIEHIKNDNLFLLEIHRVLKQGGVAIITTPNRKMSLTRNPWHIREYLSHELFAMVNKIFSRAILLGISGNEKVMKYYEENKKSVQKITRFDILNLQYRLPSPILRIPYELMNRINRNLLRGKNTTLVNTISHEDYTISDKPEDALDLLCIMYK